jgi:hypothetical protein
MGRGATAAGRIGGGKGCCAIEAGEKARDAAMAAIAIRVLEKGIGINITGWRKMFRCFEYRKTGPKGNAARSPD